MPIDYNCIDCGEFTDSYMISDELWKTVVYNKRDCLCLCCLEKRIKRKFVLEDFPRIKINIPIRVGFTMAIRKYKEFLENAPS